MRVSRAIAATFLLVGLLANSRASAQALPIPSDGDVLAERWADLTLSTSCEAGFRRFMHMAEAGQLGKDVSNANVGVWKNHARVELVGVGARNKVVILTPKSSTQTFCRYFDIEPGEGATAVDVIGVGKALDEVFLEDPFELAGAFFEMTPGGAPIPSLADVWRLGGWGGVVRVLERRMAALVGIPYTIVVIAAAAATALVSLLLLWGSAPADTTADTTMEK